MAFHALDVRVRRILIGRKFRGHHGMAGLPAEVLRIHIGNAFIGGKGENQDIQERSGRDEQQTVPNHRNLKVNFGIGVGKFSGIAQLAAAQVDSDRDQNQAQNEKAGQNQE